MKSRSTSPKGTPHLTPASLVGQRFSKDVFKGIAVALVGFCPRPNSLDQYDPQNRSDQYFIHMSPSNVQICNHNGAAFLSMAHVYGGPVSSALIEELAFYGIKYVLAYGLAGGLGTNNQKMGDFYIVERALALDGTTPHYTEEKLIPSDKFLNAKILDLSAQKDLPEITPVQAMTADAIYREYDQYLEYGRDNGCDIANCDSAHLFAVSREVGIKTTQCGVISDVAVEAGEEWESTLSAMLSEPDDVAPGPIELVGKMVEFYVEELMPELLREETG